jgi:hypothetical protein
MKCEWVRENVLLYVYEEMEDDARCEVEQHVAGCAECARELEQVREFQTAMKALPAQEPGPNLLAASRMRLQESLEESRQNGFWHRLVFEPAVWLRQIRFAPALAVAIFVAGFAGGVGTAYKVGAGNGRPVSPVTETSAPVTESTISGIRSISQQPGSSQINIQYDTVSAQEAQGSLSDRPIQQLLLFAARNTYKTDVRMDSVDLLTQKPDDANVREALMYALCYDATSQVRLKALGALKPYVKSDIRVRNVMLSALLNDTDPDIRTEALRSVQPVRADTSVRTVLNRLAQEDESKDIRSQARTELALVPQID